MYVFIRKQSGQLRLETRRQLLARRLKKYSGGEILALLKSVGLLPLISVELRVLKVLTGAGNNLNPGASIP